MFRISQVYHRLYIPERKICRPRRRRWPMTGSYRPCAVSGTAPQSYHRRLRSWRWVEIRGCESSRQGRYLIHSVRDSLANRDEFQAETNHRNRHGLAVQVAWQELVLAPLLTPQKNSRVVTFRKMVLEVRLGPVPMSTLGQPCVLGYEDDTRKEDSDRREGRKS